MDAWDDWLPPPLWERAGVGGGREFGVCGLPLSLTLPHNGGGNDGAKVQASRPRNALRIRMQNPAARFRQRKGREEEHTVSRYRENCDGVGERCRGRERADQERKQRADAAAEIVAEALARSAQPGRKEFREERAHAGEIP